MKVLVCASRFPGGAPERAVALRMLMASTERGWRAGAQQRAQRETLHHSNGTSNPPEAKAGSRVGFFSLPPSVTLKTDVESSLRLHQLLPGAPECRKAELSFLSYGFTFCGLKGHARDLFSHATFVANSCPGWASSPFEGGTWGRDSAVGAAHPCSAALGRGKRFLTTVATPGNSLVCNFTDKPPAVRCSLCPGALGDGSSLASRSPLLHPRSRHRRQLSRCVAARPLQNPTLQFSVLMKWKCPHLRLCQAWRNHLSLWQAQSVRWLCPVWQRRSKHQLKFANKPRRLQLVGKQRCWTCLGAAAGSVLSP